MPLCANQQVQTTPSERLVRFASPVTGEPLQLTTDGEAWISTSRERYPIVNGIPRFVASEEYAAGFGLEWRTHSKIQLDSWNGLTLSRDRLVRALGRSLESCRDKTVLEAGCGAGRFTEVLVGAGALVHSIDLSSAVEANRENIGSAPNYTVAQADLCRAPFAAESFDIVLCLGVLQHTASTEAAIEALWKMVKPGGVLVIDHYAWDLSIITKLAPIYRLGIKRLPPATAKAVTDRLVDWFFPMHWGVRGMFPLQALLSRVSPCQVYIRVFPELSRAQHYELCRLDTFDQLADHYKRLRTRGQIRRALAGLGARNIAVARAGNGIEARCEKPLMPKTRT